VQRYDIPNPFVKFLLDNDENTFLEGIFSSENKMITMNFEIPENIFYVTLKMILVFAIRLIFSLKEWYGADWLKAKQKPEFRFLFPSFFSGF